METGIRPGYPRFRLWWTILCAVGAALFVYRSYFVPNRNQVTSEIVLRIYAQRALGMAMQFRSAGPAQRFFLGIPTETETVRSCLIAYQRESEMLSSRGLVEYGILLAESGRLNDAREAFQRAQTAGATANLLDSENAIAASWTGVNSDLAGYLPSCQPKWGDAARVLSDIYGNTWRPVDATNGSVVPLSILEDHWRLPLIRQLTRETARQQGIKESGLQNLVGCPTFARRLTALALGWWSAFVVAAVLVWRCHAAIRLIPQPSSWAFRYFRKMTLGRLASVFVRGQFYMFIVGYVCGALPFSSFSYWLSLVPYAIVFSIFLPYYGWARLMPSVSFVRRAYNLRLANGSRSILGMTALLWLAQVPIERVYYWLVKVFPSGYRLTDSLRYEIVLNPSLLSLAMIFTLAVILAPCAEEIFFRGIMYPSLRARLGVKVGIITCGFVFAFVHHYSWLDAVMVFVQGSLWAYGFERTNSLLPGRIVHCLGNCFWAANTMLLYNPSFCQ